jgi:hypothetical protein
VTVVLVALAICYGLTCVLLALDVWRDGESLWFIPFIPLVLPLFCLDEIAHELRQAKRNGSR